MSSTLKNNEYIVFEPDQVLTNDHLNQLFYYLDRQNRLTRNKLLGMGIVCGLELVVTLDAQDELESITITKGCGLSSEGYLLLEGADKTYTYAVQYLPLPLPEDLPFSCRETPFYTAGGRTWLNPPIFKLMTCDQYQQFVVSNPTVPTVSNPCAPAESPASPLSPLSPPDSPVTGTTAPPFPLSNPPARIRFENYVVVLFLEASEKDLRNCDMQDCNNKGEKMVFHLRPLLVPKKYLSSVGGPCSGATGGKAPEIKLRRFNVDYTELTSAAEILEAFEKVVTSGVIDNIADAYHYCYTHYRCLLPDPDGLTSPPGSPPDFDLLRYNLKTILAQIVGTTNRITLQYFYDYLNDLILAYYEFREVADAVNTQCCADTCAFPLHLMLGEAMVSTSAYVREPYRQYFLYSPLFDGNVQALDKMRFYFRRMEIMAGAAAFPITLAQSTRSIRITPSQYREFPLSARAIPYYYPENSTDPNSLYQYWNFAKTAAGDAAFNLSYNAHLYNAYDAVVNAPLEYDIEYYNFFRIEGHIGLPYQDTLTYLLNQRKRYNLPFDIVAVSAEMLNTNATVPKCNILDLETDFRLLVVEFLCKLLRCLYKPTELQYAAMDQINAGNFTGLSDLSAAAIIESFPLEFGSYNYGDFIKAFSPAAGTVGATYLANISNGVFTTPIDNDYYVNIGATSGNFYSNLFGLLNTADVLFYTLLNTAMTGLQQADLSNAYTNFDTRFAALYKLLDAARDAKTNETAASILFDSCGCDCLVCLLEELLVLLLEYEKRVKYYEAQLSFVRYFLKHPGLEHKAGVPKGGTFVLVYHEEVIRPLVDVAAGVSAAGAAVSGGVALSVNEQVRELLLKNGYSASMVSEVGAMIGTSTSEIGINIQPIPNGAVIADFYVPYICCSDCPPVAYILPNVQLSISMANTAPSNQTGIEAITVGPVDPNGQVVAGGSIAAAVIHNADNSWSFDPSTLFPAATDEANYVAASATVTGTLTYTLNGANSAALNVTVYRVPLATFSAQVLPRNPTGAANELQVSSDETNTAFGYAWTVQLAGGQNANPEPSGTDATIAIGNSASATITLVVSNGTYSATTTNTIPVISLASPICSNVQPVAVGGVTAQGALTTTPATAGLVALQNNGWLFDPSKAVIPAGSASVPVTLSYTQNRMTAQPLPVQVQLAPAGIKFKGSIASQDAGKTYLVTLTPSLVDNNLSYQWTGAGRGFQLNSTQPVATVTIPDSAFPVEGTVSITAEVTLIVKNSCGSQTIRGTLTITKTKVTVKIA